MLLNLVFLIINIRTTKQQPDIFVRGSSGTNVTLDVIEYIQNLQIFPEDNNRLLRRIAYVESRDGTASDTYRDNYFGGIWQVDDAVFQATNDPLLVGYHDQLRKKAFIEWGPTGNIIYTDCTIPAISGLAAQLYISLHGAERLSVEDVGGQARFWKESGYNTIASETVQTFVDGVTELEGRPNHRFLIHYKN